jgi:5,10-methylenetetrahydromethanopterin reductase
MAMTFTIGCAHHPREFAEWSRASEDAGFERVGVVDSQAIYRELYISCAEGIQATKTVQLGPRVICAYRHPTVTASAILTLNDLAPGRFRRSWHR